LETYKAMRFWTTLIETTVEPTTRQAEILKANCTYISGGLWIMEGDTNYLRDEGIQFRELGEGEVGSLGDLSGSELKQVCLDSYGIRL
jgi:flagellar biosynthesis regulator FlaF